MVYPVLLGKGKRLFAHGCHQRKLQLTDIKRYGTGIVVLELVPTTK